MVIIEFIIIFIVIYVALFILVVFGLSRIFIPNLNTKIKLPNDLPPGMQEKIEELRHLSSDKTDYLYKSYNFLTSKYRGVKRELWKDMKCLYWTLDDAWAREGFMTCTMQNQLLITFLVKGGYFVTQDIKKVHMFYGFNIHQYIKIRLDGKWIPIDIWSHNYGLQIGERPKIF